METEGSLPRSQATSPYPEPHKFSPCSTIPFLKIYFNIILQSTTRFPKLSLSLRFLHQNPVVCTYHFPHTYCMPNLGIVIVYAWLYTRNKLFLRTLSCSLDTITSLEKVRKVYFERNGYKQKFGKLIHTQLTLNNKLWKYKQHHVFEITQSETSRTM
jgi:hypothetical protein